MNSNTKGLLVTAFYVLLLEATVQTRSVSSVGFAARIVLWTLLALMVVATLTSMIRHRRFEPLGQDGAFREIGRWLSSTISRLSSAAPPEANLLRSPTWHAGHVRQQRTRSAVAERSNIQRVHPANTVKRTTLAEFLSRRC